MAAFTFALSPLLEQRTALEAERKLQLLHAERAASLERDAVVSLQTQFAALCKAFAREREPDPSAFRETLLELELVRSALAARQAAAGAANELASAAQDAYVTACREREQLQALRDRQYEAFLVEAERREEREHDEANAAGRTLAP